MGRSALDLRWWSGDRRWRFPEGSAQECALCLLRWLQHVVVDGVEVVGSAVGFVEEVEPLLVGAEAVDFQIAGWRWGCWSCLLLLL